MSALLESPRQLDVLPEPRPQAPALLPVPEPMPDPVDVRGLWVLVGAGVVAWGFGVWVAVNALL